MSRSGHSRGTADIMNKLAFIAGTSVLALSATGALAQTAAPPTSEVDAVIVTGTRTTGLKAIDSAAPVQVLDAGTLLRVGQPDLISALQQNVPSLSAQTFATDAAQLSPSFKLRGLSPNSTLVLINGKRRHGTANLAVIAGPYQGGAAPDINFIPTNWIDHVEVLTDGAAAQYGTDAVAGVVNIITKKKNSGGNIIVSAGQYMDGDGDTADLTANIGLAPLGPRSYLNLTYESKFHGHSSRGAIDPRVYNHGAFNNLSGVNAAVVNNPDYPYVNRVSGDALLHLNVGTFDAGYDLGNGFEAYSFGSFGHKNGQALENFRLPSIANGLYPLGFSPQLVLVEDDYAFTFGVKGDVIGWNADLSTTYGRDNEKLYVSHTANATAFSTLGLRQTKFYAGTLIADQWTSNLDLTKDFAVGLASPLTVAVGIEGRTDGYNIKAGELYSYALGGSQSYSGFSSIVAGSHDRNNVGVYADFAVSPIAKLKLDGAVRFEHYSDFGDTTIGKITARYDFTPAIAVRGTASTGFRAPTLAESFYSGVNVSPSSASGQFPPNSPGVASLGFSPLKPETSTNFSGGVVWHPMPRLTATFDAYYIKIDDRIVGSGTILGTSNGVVVSPAVNAALAASGYSFPPGVTTTSVSLFSNGLDTETTGAEFVVTYNTNFDKWGRVDWSLSGSYNNTAVTSIAPSPVQIRPQLLFDKTAISFLQDAPEKFKIIAGGLWNVGAFTVNLRETLHGPAHLFALGPDNVTYFENKVSTTVITDLEVSYNIGHGLKLTGGANNLFNQYPEKVNPAYLAAFVNLNRQGGTVQYPTSFSPYGFNGGYYYGKISYTF